MEIISKAIKMSIDNKEILKGIDLEVADKEFIGIIGPNGSGKSTFLKCLYRVQKPSAGKFYFAGKNLDEMSFRESALQLAVVAQHNFYNFDFSVLDVVLMGRAPHKKILERDSSKDYKIALDSLRIVGLEGFENRSFTTLSGGEQQRVILARALTQQTECLILDEPTNHLDIKYQLQIMDIVKSLNLTIVAAIHDLNIAAMYCDKLIALKAGQIVGRGSPKELLTRKFIKELYGVEAIVDLLKDDLVSIRYIPHHLQRTLL